NSTFSGDSGANDVSVLDATLALTNVTLVNSGTILQVSGGNALLKNNILKGGTACSLISGGTVSSAGANLTTDGSCGLAAVGDQVTTRAALALAPLADNGGSTPTHALLAGSAAINAAPLAGCPETDQRGVARPQVGLCDSGAYESRRPLLTNLSPTGVA